MATKGQSAERPPRPTVVVQWRADVSADPGRWVQGLVEHYPLFLELVRRDVKARYVQSVLGLYWTFINPLFTAAVLTVVFSVFVRVPVAGAPYFLMALTGLLGWSLFANAVSDATQSLVAHANLLGKVPFPRELLPAASVTARVVDFLASAAVLLALIALFATPSLSLAVLWLPLLLAVQLAFTLGVGLVLAMANVFYRDVRQLVQLLLMLGFYLTPVLYPVALVPERYRALYLLNPMAALIDGYRRTLLHRQPPDWPAVGVAAAASLAVLAAGYWVFKRQEPFFAERV